LCKVGYLFERHGCQHGRDLRELDEGSSSRRTFSPATTVDRAFFGRR
jgi:hypothetical protein